MFLLYGKVWLVGFIVFVVFLKLFEFRFWNDEEVFDVWFEFFVISLCFVGYRGDIWFLVLDFGIYFL